MKKTEFNETQIKDIVERYKNGEAIMNIRKDYNVSHSTINRVLKENNVAIRGNRKHFYNEDIFKKINTAEKAYWIGFITADGYINEDRNFMRIKLQEKDKDHLYKFMKFIGGDEGMIKYEFHNITGDKQWYIEVSGKTFIKSLVELGIRQKKSSNEQWCNKIPEKYIKDYIRGIIDGDGHISLENKRFDICNSESLLIQLQNFLIKEYNTSKTKIYDHCNTKRLFVTVNATDILFDLYYKKCVSLDRKYKTVKILKQLIEL